MPPPIIKRTRLVLVAGEGAGRREDFAAGVKPSNASTPACSAASRRMVRTSSSTERPLRAARRRRSFLSRSSSCRTVSEAMRKTLFLSRLIPRRLHCNQCYQTPEKFASTLDAKLQMRASLKIGETRVYGLRRSQHIPISRVSRFRSFFITRLIRRAERAGERFNVGAVVRAARLQALSPGWDPAAGITAPKTSATPLAPAVPRSPTAPPRFRGCGAAPHDQSPLPSLEIAPDRRG